MIERYLDPKQYYDEMHSDPLNVLSLVYWGKHRFQGSVFISHATNDDELCSRTIVNTIESLCSNFVLDDRSADPIAKTMSRYFFQNSKRNEQGSITGYQALVHFAFAYCKTIIFAIIKSAASSSWVKHEAALAIDQNHPIILCVFDDTDVDQVEPRFLTGSRLGRVAVVDFFRLIEDEARAQLQYTLLDSHFTPTYLVQFLPEGWYGDKTFSFPWLLRLRQLVALANDRRVGYRRGEIIRADLLLAKGRLRAALKSYRYHLRIREKVAVEWPRSITRHDVSVAYAAIGTVLHAQDNLAGALENYRASLEIKGLLAQDEPNSFFWKHDMCLVHNRIGKVLQVQKDLSGALKSYQDSLTIRKHLARARPHDLCCQRDVSSAHEAVGKVFLLMGDLSSALDSYQAALTNLSRMAKTNQQNIGWQRDLAHYRTNIRSVLTKQQS